MKDKGREITEQKRAEKLRAKKKKIENMKPGAISDITTGLALKQSPMTVMKNAYTRRKYDREQKRKNS